MGQMIRITETNNLFIWTTDDITAYPWYPSMSLSPLVERNGCCNVNYKISNYLSQINLG